MATIWNRQNQEMDEANQVRLVEQVLRRLLPSTPALQRRGTFLGRNPQNGYFDENGEFVEWWSTSDVAGSKPHKQK